MSERRFRDTPNMHARTKAVGQCPVCRKRVYANKREAKATARSLGLFARGTVYRKHGGAWHITSHPEAAA